MAEGTLLLLSIIGALITVLTTLLLAQLSGIRRDLREALRCIGDHREEIKEIKTVFLINGCMDSNGNACHRRKDDR